MSFSNKRIYRLFNNKAALCALFLLLIVIPLTLTLSDYGITFDEPIYMEASKNIGKWLSLEPAQLFSQNEIEYHWKTDPRRNIHPSGLKWLYLVAQKAIFWEKDFYQQNRVLNIFILAFSLLAFFLWWGGNSLFRAVVFTLLLLSIPRFYAHTHFAATDIPMTSFLLLFLVSLTNFFFGKTFWLAGILLGAFASIKITSAVLTIPVLLVFLVWYRHDWKTVLLRIIVICSISLLVFYVLNPDWWFSPFLRCREFLIQSLTRRSWSPFTVYFAGQFYSYRGPFYYPFAMFLITTPILHIMFLFLGIIHFFSDRRLHRDLKMVLAFTSLVSPFLIMALPISPTNDGVRYLLPAFPFAACFMTIGLERLLNFVKKPLNTSIVRRAFRWVVAAFSVTLLAMDLHNPARCPPYELSYYNGIVGGISGSLRNGFESTYWGEIFNDNNLRQLNRLCAGSRVYFPFYPPDLFLRNLQNSNKIKFYPVVRSKHSDFMVIFGRPFTSFWEEKTTTLTDQKLFGNSLSSIQSKSCANKTLHLTAIREIWDVVT